MLLAKLQQLVPKDQNQKDNTIKPEILESPDRLLFLHCSIASTHRQRVAVHNFVNFGFTMLPISEPEDIAIVQGGSLYPPQS